MTLPHRFTEKSFRRYEATIAELVDRFPQPITILAQQMGLSLCTISNRLRDAIRSYDENKWPSRIDRRKFDEIKLDIIVKEGNDAVTVCFKNQLEVATQDGFFRLGVQGIKDVFVEPHELSTIGKLAGEGALSKPVFCRASKQQIEELEASFNVSAMEQEDGSYKII